MQRPFPTNFMLKVILYLLLIGICAHADTVHLGWDYSDPIDHFRIYTGETPYKAQNVFVVSPEFRRAAVEVPGYHYMWITAAGNGESDPSPALQYRPVTVELVIQESEDLREWSAPFGIFSFSIPEGVTGEQRLNITRIHVEVRAYGQLFQVPVPTGTGKKFFRSFVVVPTF